MAGGSCCWGRSRSRRVSPSPDCQDLHEIVEIRPKRKLRVKHINPQPRDEKFEKELQTFLKYRRQGYQLGVSTGPLTVPKKKLESSTENTLTEVLPNSTNGGTESLDVPTCENNIIAGLQSKESTFTSASPIHQPAGIRSASSVQVAMHQSKLPGNRTVLQDDRVSGQQKQHDNSIFVPQNNSIYPVLEPEHGKASSSQDPSSKHSSQTEDLGVVLFFLHGVGGSSDIWKPQIDFFASKGYEIVAPDLIGHGLSCAPRNAKAYHFDEIMADIEEIFDRYCKRKNMVIGHSYGCSFAAVLGRRRSRRVTKLVMISGGGPTPLAPQPGVFTLPVCCLGCVRPCIECGFKKSAFNGTKSPVVPPEETFAIPTYVLSYTMNGQEWPDGDEIFHNWLMSPSLLIYGLNDRLVTLAEEKDMEEAIYQSHLEVIEEASHMVMIEAPDKVNQLMHNFLLKGLQVPPRDSSPVRESEERSVSRVSQKSAKSMKSLPHHLLSNSFR